MYTQYSLTPKKSNNIAAVLITLLFVGAAALFIFTAVFGDIAYRGILQTISLVLVIAALAVATRYVFKYFTYEIRENGERGLDFDVVETQGKRRYTVCRIGLENIEKVEVMTAENKKALKKEFLGRKKFYYLPDMLPSRTLAVFVTECGEPLVLVLSYDEMLLKILTTV